MGVGENMGATDVAVGVGVAPGETGMPGRDVGVGAPRVGVGRPTEGAVADGVLEGVGVSVGFGGG